MDDAYYRDRLSAYADNQLPLDERQAVEQHLAENAESRRMLEEIIRLKKFTDAHGELDDTDYFEQNARAIEQRLGLAESTEVTDIAQPRFSGLGWKIAATAASIAILTFIGLNTDEIGRMLASPDRQTPRSETPQPAEVSDQARQFRDRTADEQVGAPETPPQKDNKIEGDRSRATISEGNVDADEGEAAMVPPASEPRSTTDQELALQDAEEVHSDRIAVDADRKQVAAAGPKLERVPESTDSQPATRAAKETERTLAIDQSGTDQLDQIRQAARTLIGASGRHGLPGVNSLAESSKQAEGVGAVENEQSMEVWRARRDSLLPIYLTMTGDTTVAGKHATEAAAKGRLSTGEHSLPDIERQLIESWYIIARYSPHSGEQDDAREALERYSVRRAAHHAAMARDKIRTLDSLARN